MISCHDRRQECCDDVLVSQKHAKRDLVNVEKDIVNDRRDLANVKRNLLHVKRDILNLTYIVYHIYIV